MIKFYINLGFLKRSRFNGKGPKSSYNVASSDRDRLPGSFYYRLVCPGLYTYEQWFLTFSPPRSLSNFPLVHASDFK